MANAIRNCLYSELNSDLRNAFYIYNVQDSHQDTPCGTMAFDDRHSTGQKKEPGLNKHDRITNTVLFSIASFAVSRVQGSALRRLRRLAGGSEMFDSDVVEI